MSSPSRRKIVFVLELFLVLTFTLTWQSNIASAKPLPQLGPYSIWDDTATPANLSFPDTNAIELGVKFQADVDGYITGIRFYKGASNTGTHIGNLWSSDGTLLGTATFINETDSGWQQVNFAAPVQITANTTYVASYHTDVGYYAVDGGYFGSSGFDNPPLRALADGVDGGNGVYQYGPTGFPSSTYNAANYWVDVVFAIPDTTPPTVSVTNPADGAAVSGTVMVSADATDDVGVAGVQFLLDGANLGAEDTAPPYSISWDSTTVADGVHQLAAVARDEAGNTTTSSTVSVTVDNNTMPTVTITTPADGATFIVGQSISFNGTASDAEDGDLTPSLSWTSSMDGPIGNGGSFSTTGLSVGLHTITASVTDSGGLPGSNTVDITVAANTAPTVTNPGDKTNDEGDTVTLDIIASDPDGDVLTFSATGLPSGLSINASTGRIGGTLTFGSVGVHSVTLTVNDGAASTRVSFRWTVNDVNVPGDDDDDDDDDEDPPPYSPPAQQAPPPSVTSAPTPAVAFLPETGIGGYSETGPAIWPLIVILPGLGLVLSWSILRRLNKRHQ